MKTVLKIYRASSTVKMSGCSKSTEHRCGIQYRGG